MRCDASILQDDPSDAHRSKSPPMRNARQAPPLETPPRSSPRRLLLQAPAIPRPLHRRLRLYEAPPHRRSRRQLPRIQSRIRLAPHTVSETSGLPRPAILKRQSPARDPSGPTVNRSPSDPTETLTFPPSEPKPMPHSRAPTLTQGWDACRSPGIARKQPSYLLGLSRFISKVRPRLFAINGKR